MKIAIPAQNVRMDQSTGVDPIWYGKLKIVETFINGGTLGDGGLTATATTGFAYLPTIVGPPTGTPIAKPGFVATAFDPATNRLWIYNGTAWKSVVLT